MSIISIIVVIFCLLGLIFYTGGAVGIIRMPDFYSRLHPAGQLDTLGLLLFAFALSIYELRHFCWESVIISLKILLILFFVFLSSPTATHSIVDAGIKAGLIPWTKDEKEK